MRAIELMLGSYVSVAPSGMIIKVAAIHKHKIGYYATTKKLVWVRMSLVRPIPITPELLLEKLGFDRIIHYKAFMSYRHDNGDITNISYNFQSGTVTIDGNPFCLVNKVCERPQRIEAVGCRYLHELQNRLRILGIELEIKH